MKFGCSTLAYQFTGWPIDVALESIASMGYEGVEIDFGKNPFEAEMRPGPDYFIENEKDFSRMLKRLNLKFPSACIMSPWSGSESRIKEAKDTLVGVTKLAKIYGIDNIVVVAGPAARELSREVVWEQVIENLKWASEYTRERGIRLSMEVVATWPIYDTKTFLAAKKAIGENFYVNLDPSNFYQGGDDPIQAVSDLKGYIISVHLKDAKTYKKVDDNVPAARGYCQMGEGDIDFTRLLRALKGIGYDGWLQAEYEGFFGGYNPDPVKGSEDTYKYISNILKSLK